MHRAGIAGTWPCRTWHYPPRYRTANAPRSCSELASRYQAALSRRIRGSYTIRPVIGGKIGPGRSEYPPRDYAAQSGHQRVSAPCSQRVGAPLPGSVIGTSAPSAELATKSGTIRPAIGQRNCGRSGKYPPRYWASNSGNWRPVSAPWSPRHIRDRLQGTIRPVVSQCFSGKYPPRYRTANSGGARGEHYPPRYRQENRGRLPRALSAPLPALLAPRYRTSGHNSARVRAVYIRTRQPAGHRCARPGT